jgi:hypothetical protein
MPAKRRRTGEINIKIASPEVRRSRYASRRAGLCAEAGLCNGKMVTQLRNRGPLTPLFQQSRGLQTGLIELFVAELAWGHGDAVPAHQYYEFG